MNSDYKRIKFGANLVIVSEAKELETGKGIVFLNFLARPAAGPVVRLNFYGYHLSELERIVSYRLKKGVRIEVIGFLTGVYDEKPDITVRYFKVQGQPVWQELVM
jgi:hypothetical protein